MTISQYESAYKKDQNTYLHKRKMQGKHSRHQSRAVTPQPLTENGAIGSNSARGQNDSQRLIYGADSNLMPIALPSSSKLNAANRRGHESYAETEPEFRKNKNNETRDGIVSLNLIMQGAMQQNNAT